MATFLGIPVSDVELVLCEQAAEALGELSGHLAKAVAQLRETNQRIGEKVLKMQPPTNKDDQELRRLEAAAGRRRWLENFCPERIYRRPALLGPGEVELECIRASAEEVLRSQNLRPGETYEVAVYHFERVERYVMGQLVLQEEEADDTS
jgi:hypothetical protein